LVAAKIWHGFGVEQTSAGAAKIAPSRVFDHFTFPVAGKMARSAWSFEPSKIRPWKYVGDEPTAPPVCSVHAFVSMDAFDGPTVFS
jgi:hypothetical protein